VASSLCACFAEDTSMRREVPLDHGRRRKKYVEDISFGSGVPLRAQQLEHL